MVVADANNQVLVELGPDISLLSGPQGFYKSIEIGVNNYDPQQFMSQHFTIYFFKRDSLSLPSNSSPEGMPSSTMRNETEIMK
jgi:hypothetical protein